MKEYIFPPLKAEIANSVSHLLGVFFSIYVLIVVSIQPTMSSLSRFSMLVFACSMLLMYSASTIYHAVSNIPVKKVLRVFDHINIYFQIAGTYTPFLLLCVKGTLGWIFFGIVWGVALLGIIYKVYFWKKHPKWSLFIYLGMGWLILFIIKPLYNGLPIEGLIWLVVGGVFFSIGTIFYSWKSKTYTHAVWHLFVLAGSISHFMAVLYIK